MRRGRKRIARFTFSFCHQKIIVWGLRDSFIKIVYTDENNSRGRDTPDVE